MKTNGYFKGRFRLLYALLGGILLVEDIFTDMLKFLTYARRLFPLNRKETIAVELKLDVLAVSSW